MERLSFTSVSKAAALLTLVLAPVVYAELYVVPKKSGRAREMRTIGYEEAASSGRKWLLLGDSTARRLHFWPPVQVDPVLRADDPILNFGLGGSSVVDWSLLCERGFRAVPDLERVAVLSSASVFGNVTNAAESPYVAYLSGWRDAVFFARSGELRVQDAARLAVKQVVHLYSDRNDVLFTLFAEDPDLRPWADRLSFREPPHGKIFGEAAPPRSPERLTGWFRRLLDCATRAPKKPLFILSPLHSAERATPLHQDRINLFKAVCDTGRVRCLSLETAYPDDAFVEDRVHLKPEFEEPLRDRIKKELP